MLMVALDSNVEFRGEKRRIKLIIISFVVSCVLWSIYRVCVLQLRNLDPYFDILFGDLIMTSLCTLVPIFLVLYIHLSNVISLGKIVGLSWIRRNIHHESLGTGDHSPTSVN